MPPLLIFDLDGTLIDSETGIITCLQKALHDFGIYRQTQDIRKLIGYSLREMVARLLEITNEDEQVTVLCNRYQQYYAESVYSTTTLYPEVLTTLEKLHDCPKAVATNKKHETVLPLIDYFGLGQHFLHIQGITPAITPKPSPALIMEVLQALHFSKDHVLYIGDTDKDIRAGKAAGSLTVAATYGIMSKEELIPFDPDYFLDRFSDLEGIVKSLSKLQNV